MVGFRCLPMAAARGALDIHVLLTLGGAIGFGMAYHDGMALSLRLPGFALSRGGTEPRAGMNRAQSAEHCQRSTISSASPKLLVGLL